MKVFNSITEWVEYSKSLKGSLGFVPTMGALHKGHLSLIEASFKENTHTLVSIFLNPTQFNDPKDLKNYPSNLNQDIANLKSLKNSDNIVLITPSSTEMYPDNFNYKVSENEISSELCGSARPGHFEAVLTVVLKLLNIANADKAYFGEKDYQQYLLIKKMTEAFFHKTKIIACPTIREISGLAVSSRNKLLSKEALVDAAKMHKAIIETKDITKAKDQLSDLGFKVDYLEDHLSRRFVAAYLNNVRLIDNVER